MRMRHTGLGEPDQRDNELSGKYSSEEVFLDLVDEARGFPRRSEQGDATHKRLQLDRERRSLQSLKLFRVQVIAVIVTVILVLGALLTLRSTVTRTEDDGEDPLQWAVAQILSRPVTKEPAYKSKAVLQPFLDIIEESWPEENSHRVRFLPEERRGHEGFRISHIPKTAITAFESEAKKQIKVNETMDWHEDCLTTSKHPTYSSSEDYVLMFFREPHAHVLSQYFQCDYGWSGLEGPEYDDFPRVLPHRQLAKAEGLLARAKETGRPSDYLNRRYRDKYVKTMNNMDNWLDHFLTNWTLEKGGFACYDPRDMQTRALVCNGVWDALHLILDESLLNPNLQLAINRMKSLWHVGISELFHESVCIWEYQYHGQLPNYCNCALGLERPLIPAVNHNVPRHSVSDVSSETLAKINGFTQKDHVLYEEAIREFVLRLREVERTTKTKILC